MPEANQISHRIFDDLFGYGKVSRVPVPSSWWGADRSIDPLPYRPDEARAFLARMGDGGKISSSIADIRIRMSSRVMLKTM